MRIKVKCESKNRDSKGAIVDYTLVDETGKRFQATGQQIKEEMNKENYEFINLQLDKAGRLVDKAENKKNKSNKTLELSKYALSRGKWIIDHNKKNIQILIDIVNNSFVIMYLDTNKLRHGELNELKNCLGNIKLEDFNMHNTKRNAMILFEIS